MFQIYSFNFQEKIMFNSIQWAAYRVNSDWSIRLKNAMQVLVCLPYVMTFTHICTGIQGTNTLKIADWLL